MALGVSSYIIRVYINPKTPKPLKPPKTLRQPRRPRPAGRAAPSRWRASFGCVTCVMGLSV